MGIKFLSTVGNHPFNEYLLAFPQVVLFLFGQLYPLDFLRDERIFHTHGNHLVGKFVYAHEGRDVFPVTSLQFHDTPHVACFKQVLLVLFGKDVSEIRTVKFGFLTDTVDAQYDGTSHGLLE